MEHLQHLKFQTKILFSCNTTLFSVYLTSCLTLPHSPHERSWWYQDQRRY